MNPRGLGYFIASNGGGNANAGPSLVELLDPAGGSAIFPVGALVPGPEFTVPRSVKPTTPTAVVWASTGYIDFVADCGADPTGATDCGAAITQMWALMLALSATSPSSTCVRCFVPPGTYLVTTIPTPANFTGKATAFEIFGVRDASIFLVGNADSIFNAQNQEIAYIHDLSFRGTQAAPATDTAVCIATVSTAETIIANVHFDWLLCQQAVVREGGAIRLRDCIFSGCGVSDPTKALVWSNGGSLLDLENVKFLDPPHMNDVAPSASKFPPAWVRQDDSSTISSGGYNYVISFRRCWFDENVFHAIFVKSGINRIGKVSVEDCYFNPSALAPSAGALMHIEGVDTFRARRITNSGFNNLVPGPLVELVGVKDAYIEQVNQSPGAASNGVTADAACGLLEIVDAPDMLTSGIASLAARTFVTRDGLRASVLQASAAESVGAVLKITSVAGVAGYAPIAAGDGVGLAVGIALDAPALSAPQRGALRNQRVPTLSDGTTAIAIGDPITNLGAAAPGQVLKATATGVTPVLGVAMTAAAAGGGPVLFDMMFGTGEA